MCEQEAALSRSSTMKRQAAPQQRGSRACVGGGRSGVRSPLLGACVLREAVAVAIEWCGMMKRAPLSQARRDQMIDRVVCGPLLLPGGELTPTAAAAPPSAFLRCCSSFSLLTLVFFSSLTLFIRICCLYFVALSLSPHFLLLLLLLLLLLSVASCWSC